MFTENQQVREEELVALRHALEIITENTVHEKYSGNVVQKMPGSFLQIQSAGHTRVIDFLHQRGLALSSKTLSSFASQVSADPFGKVTTMIRDLLDRLQQEAAAEASHKVRCSFVLSSSRCFVSEEVLNLNCCVNITIRHGAMLSCTRTRTKEMQSLSRYRNLQLKWRSWNLTLQTWLRNWQL